MTDAISDEMVEAAAKAIFDLSEQERVADGSPRPADTWPAIHETAKVQYRAFAHAALAAALPLIVATERENCAKIAESYKCELCGQLFHESQPHTDDECSVGHSSWTGLHQSEIATAIRSGNGGE